MTGQGLWALGLERVGDHGHGDNARRTGEVLGAEASVIEQQNEARRMPGCSVQLEPECGKRSFHLPHRVETARIRTRGVRRPASGERHQHAERSE